MTPTFKKFIEKNIDLIETLNLEQAYDLLDSGAAPELTEMLLKIDIDPLQHMSVVPDSYMAGKLDLTEVFIPDHVTLIRNDAFFACANLKTVHLPSNLALIGRGAFEESGLTSISFPERLKYIEEDAFSVTKLRDVKLPDKLKNISNFCFEECPELKSVSLGANITHVGNRAFARCKKLQFVDLNEGLLEIGEYAFDECSALDTLYIPPSVVSIHPKAFRGCKNLVIQCEEESFAHTYAQTYRYNYQLV